MLYMAYLQRPVVKRSARRQFRLVVLPWPQDMFKRAWARPAALAPAISTKAGWLTVSAT